MQEDFLFGGEDDVDDVGIDDESADKTVSPWKLLIVDDEPEVHTLTKLNLHSLEFRGAGLSLISAHSASEAEAMLQEHTDIAVILLDVVMESDTSGLKLVNKIRNEMDNKRVRIILRTGQPGHAPEAEVVLKYDINDYRAKTDLTQERLITSVVGALRNYADMLDLEKSERRRQHVEEKSAARSLFLASVSHEVRTPMHGILGTLELLSNTKPDNDQHALIKICHDSASYLLSIIDDILDFSKIDAGKLDISHEKVNPADLVYGALDQLASKAWLKDIEIAATIASNVPSKLECDPVRLQQVLTNLVGNAIKFTHEGHVHVRVWYEASESEPAALHFEVEDTGVGVSEEESARLFSAFEQASLNTSRKYGGTGLGLAISRQLVELMNGDIGLTSEVNVGSTFRFYVQVGAASETGGASTSLDNKLILLVADQGISTDVAKAALEDAGATVSVLSDASNIVDKLMQQIGVDNRYDAVLIDETVSQQHCIHWFRQVHQEDVLKRTPVGVMVRRSSGSLISRLRGLGIEQILMKVLRKEELIAAAGNLVGQEVRPLTIAEIQDQNSNMASLGDVVTTRLRFPDARVLVAEDSLTNQVVIRRMLEHLSVTVRTVENGREALEALALGAGNYHLVFMDCFMPDMEGQEVVRKLREFEKDTSDRLSVVALSASFLPQDIKSSLEAGMDDYVSKPTDIATLAQVLDKWLPDTCTRIEVDADDALVSDDVSAFQAKAGKISMTEEADKAGIDLTTILEVYGDLNGKVRVLVDIFMRDVPIFLQRLEAASLKMDSEGARRAAHNIAGSCGVIGGTKLGDAAQAVEAYARNEDWAKVEEELPNVSSLYERMCRFYEAVDWNL